MPKMSNADLKTMLAAEKADALAAISAARLAEERADAMDYYLGNMRKDMPAQEGRSRVVSTDVADTVEGLMPHLMDIFAGSDEVVRFEPVGPEDEAAAAQETDYVNHVFMQQNPGFMILYSFIKDALLSKVGVVKVWWEEREEESRETYYDLSEDQFALLAQSVMDSDGAMRIVAHSVRGGEDGLHQSSGRAPSATGLMVSGGASVPGADAHRLA
ncbi:portal protein [Bradyrhizobium sp. HKCCYLS3013]|uniref:portal protein n=1 Tax=Bradyrhizobium sp. HKCCYLS3013 TaxID=3420735 RepID=UPI003EBF7DAD